MVAPKSFKGSDGKIVEYNEHYFQVANEDGTSDVVVLNSQKDFSDKIGEENIVAIVRFDRVAGTDSNGKPLKGVFKPKLIEVRSQ